MGIFKRITAVGKSFINRKLDNIEDNEDLLESYLEDMSKKYQKARKDVAEAMASKKEMEEHLVKEYSEKEKWSARVENAVKAENDELALEALAIKNNYEKSIEELEQFIKKQDAIVKQLQEGLTILKAKIGEASRHKDLIIARQKRVNIQKNIQEAIKSLKVNNDLKITCINDDFNRLEKKVTSMERQLAAENELDEELYSDDLEKKFKSLEEDQGSSLKRELEQIKKRVKHHNEE